jgi:hypothetical protein
MLKPWRRTWHWVKLLPGDKMPRGRIYRVEPHGGGGNEGGVKFLVVRRG